VDDGLDVVAVGVPDVNGIVAGMVLGAEGRGALVPAARGKGRRVEGVDRRAALGDEGDVGT
jgi:hypothetical protein